MQYDIIIKEIISHYKSGMIPVIYGQTATGKTRLSLELAKKFKEEFKKDIEIISADSRQVYRYMDIGTDKIGQDIRNQIIHHMIDIIDPDEIYTAGQWQQDSYQIIDDIISRNNLPVIVGGTGLYIDTIVYNFNMGIVEPNLEYRAELEEIAESEKLKAEGSPCAFGFQSSVLRNMLNEIDPVEAAKHHPSSTRFIIRALEIYKQTGIPKSELMIRQKPKFPLLMIGLGQDVALGNRLIDERLKTMIENGLIQEVQKLLDMGYDTELSSMKSIDYKQTVEWLIAQDKRLKAQSDLDLKLLTYSDYITSLQIANHQLAKKQRTRFRRYKRDAEHCQNYDTNNDITYLDFYLPDYLS